MPADPSRCKYCRRSLAAELDTDVLLNGGLCTECTNEERREREDRDDDFDTSDVDTADYPCIADDSTECDCPRCVVAEDRFWREQGEQAGELGDDRCEPDDAEDRP